MLLSPPIIKDLTGFPYTRKARRFVASGGPGARSILSDLFSTMQSEIRYGKATSISLVKRPQYWGTELTRTPTAEQVEDPEGGKRFFIGKNQAGRQPPRAIVPRRLAAPGAKRRFFGLSVRKVT